MKDKTRRKFLLKSLFFTGYTFVPKMILQACNDDDPPVTELETPEVIDKEIWYVNEMYNDQYRSIPSDPGFLYFSGLPGVPRVQPVPFSWGKENFYSGNSGYLTDNVYIEPDTSRILQLVISTPGLGDSASGSPQYKIWYRTSTNNGKTFSPLKQVIVSGYNNVNPIDGVIIGRNGFNVDFTRPVVRASNGEIMVPCGLHPWDEENQRIYLPVSNAYLFQDAGVIIGSWLPDGSDVTWKFGGWLRIDYNKSTRGLSEPTIIETKRKGKFAMVARCSNLGRPELPGYAWVSFSYDYCRTWSDPTPFTYTNGENFFVPAAHSTLFRLSKNGKVYWIGNLNESNPKGSHPRYPLVIAEVDTENFGLIKDTVVLIDTRHDNEDVQLQLSNFKVMENVEKGEIIIVCTRREGTKVAVHPSWYRVRF